MVRSYGEVTGDLNPLHFDADFVARTRFGRPIAQGGITKGMLHALVAIDMPGPGTVFVRQRWSFPTCAGQFASLCVRPLRSSRSISCTHEGQKSPCGYDRPVLTGLGP